MVDYDFRIFLKESDYRLDRRQKKMIKRSVEDTFGQEALLVYKRHQANSCSNPFQGEEQISKALLPARHCYKRERVFSEDKNLERLYISTGAPKSYDMSLLGPGESCPSPALLATSVGLHNGPAVSSEPSHTDSGRKGMEVSHMECRTAPFRGTFAQVREAKNKDPDPVMYEIGHVPLASPPGLHDVRRAPFVEDSTVRALKTKVGHRSPKVFKTVNADSEIKSSALKTAPNEREPVFLAKGAVDHVSSRYSTIGDSRLSSPESQPSTASKIFDGNGFDYGPSQHRSRKEISIKAGVGQLKPLKHWPKTDTTQSRPASSYSATLSPVVTGHELGMNTDVSHSARRRPALGHVNTLSGLVVSGKDQGHALKVDDLVTAVEHCSSDAPREQGDMPQNGRQHLWRSRYVYEGEKEGEVVDLRTYTIPRITLLPGRTSDLRTSIDESIQNTEQPLIPDQSFRRKDHDIRQDTTRSHGLNRSKNHSALSLKQRTSSRSRILHKSTHATSNQTARQGEWCQFITSLKITEV